MNEQWRKHITVEPGKRGGRPCIRGMRITVCRVALGDYSPRAPTDPDVPN